MNVYRLGISISNSRILALIHMYDIYATSHFSYGEEFLV